MKNDNYNKVARYINDLDLEDHEVFHLLMLMAAQLVDTPPVTIYYASADGSEGPGSELTPIKKSPLRPYQSSIFGGCIVDKSVSFQPTKDEEKLQVSTYMKENGVYIIHRSDARSLMNFLSIDYPNDQDFIDEGAVKVVRRIIRQDIEGSFEFHITRGLDTVALVLTEPLTLSDIDCAKFIVKPEPKSN